MIKVHEELMRYEYCAKENSYLWLSVMTHSLLDTRQGAKS